MCCLSLTSGYQTLHSHYRTIYSALEVSFRIINMAQFSPCILIPGESVICSCRTHRCPQWKNTDSYPWKCIVSGIIQIQAQGICICISQIKSGKPSMTFHRFQCSFFSRIILHSQTEPFHIRCFHQHNSKHGILWERMPFHCAECQSWREVIFYFIPAAYFIDFL